MRAREVKLGMHVEHDTTGRYLGVVVRKGAATVSTQMPDDPSRGHLASFGEIRPSTTPAPDPLSDSTPLVCSTDPESREAGQ